MSSKWKGLLVCCTALVALATAAPAWAGLVVKDAFPHADGNLVGKTPEIGGTWAAHSGAGATPVQVTSNKVILAQGSGSREDVNSSFTPLVAGGKLYAGFDLIVTGGNTEVYFAHFLQGTSNFRSRVFVTAFTGNDYTLAFGHLAKEATWATGLTFGTTYRVVVSYEYTGDVGKLWINPISEGSTSISATPGTSLGVAGFAFRQASGNSTETIDNLCVATTFDEALNCTPPSGACCIGEACTITTQADCTGTWKGADTVCDPNPCLTPVGSCCVLQPYSCVTGVTEASCTTGTWTLDGTCTTECVEPTGSCCYPSYFCQDNVTEDNCPAPAIWTEGGLCVDTCIAPTGACCLPDGTCALGLTQAQCNGQYGYQWTEGATECDPACVMLEPAPVIISEYYESQPGSRKAIEIYNPTANPVSLNGHKLAMYGNLSTTPTGTASLNGLIVPEGGVLVFVNNLTEEIPGIVGTPIPAPAAVNFNGDDAIAILFGSDAGVVDRFAVPGQEDAGPRLIDPYADSAWERKCSVTTGTGDFDACNFDGQKDCPGGSACPRGTPVTCDDGLHANEWVFEGRIPDGSIPGQPHTLGWHCLPTTGACCVEGGRACACPGDMNDDNAVMLDDVAEFVDVLLGTAMDECADTNGDGFFDGRDVQDMVALILAGTICGGTEECIIATEADCLAQSGMYIGDDTTCEPNPCGPTGACCKPDWTCVDGQTVEQCAAIDQSAVWTEGGTCAEDCIQLIPEGLVINEFWADDALGDSAEYIELYCPSCGGANLSGLSVIIVDGDTLGSTSASQYKRVIGRWDLAGYTMPLDGYFVIGGGTTPNVDISFPVGTEGFIQNGTQTYAIVRTIDIAYESGSEKLTDDSVAAITANLIDAIADIDNGAGDHTYFGAPVIGPAPGGFPWDMAARIPNGVDTDSPDDWVGQDHSALNIELFDANDRLSSPGTENTTDPVGVCCREEVCTQEAISACEATSGIWQGRLLDCNDPDLNPCIPSGACCLPDDNCVQANQTACETTLGGTYKGNGTSCTPLPCGPTGSCCLPDWTCQDNLTAQQCAAVNPNATWVSGGNCAQDCVAPKGACCIEDVCYDTPPYTAVECAQVGGLYRGDGSDCSVGCPAPIVISQVYGGGGNSGATLKNDFIEIFNRGTTAMSLDGWSVQYASATGSSWQVTNLTAFVLQPGQYYLVQEAAGTGGTEDLPTPDAIGGIGMGAQNGKVALVNNTTALSGTCPLGGNVIDLVGYGTATCFEGTGPVGALSNTNAGIRKNSGCTDANDNLLDFDILLPTPRNSSSPLNPCGGGPLTPDRRVEVCTPGVDCPTTYCYYYVTTNDDAIGSGEPSIEELTQCQTGGGPLYAADTICVECLDSPAGECGEPWTYVLFEWNNYDGLGGDCYFYGILLGQYCDETCSGTPGRPVFKKAQ